MTAAAALLQPAVEAVPAPQLPRLLVVIVHRHSQAPDSCTCKRRRDRVQHEGPGVTLPLQGGAGGEDKELRHIGAVHIEEGGRGRGALLRQAEQGGKVKDLTSCMLYPQWDERME
eukprot:CAMPEP_0202921160 /NCGR_PEP_ID=MMETSP1392-20130828/77244_1 /ASSEMBLY_ACC=CAM_ASM_000868 /TAXON_ID=225041 /ORGANISM="Chlamydomonas chlamydogama, Strain SAG 11-48b" /LENGTH=114 /DNA_ID=CAMNT_0049614707 /DNA_START=1123 /DNA_END=1469 /DNA_ORIENTATION=+